MLGIPVQYPELFGIKDGGGWVTDDGCDLFCFESVLIRGDSTIFASH